MKKAFSSFSVLLLLALSCSVFAAAQFTAAPDRAKIAALKPPPGAKVAIVIFQDLQCPDCARAHPLMLDAEKTYHIPLVQHDFPLPMHNWSHQAAVIARYFDTKSLKTGNEWRDYCYANQPSITPENLRPRADQFAKEHGMALPFALDPSGKLEAKIQADFSLGQRIGIEHTPTIFVVTNSGAEPFVEVVDRTQLYSILDDAIAKTGGAGTVASAKKSGAKKTVAKKR